ncbi:hypothetical protein DICA3_C15324 [Diutina catenulata]
MKNLVCTHLLVHLYDDIVTEICTYLDIYSVISMVKALTGAPHYQALKERIANINVFYDWREEKYFMADVMAYLNKVTWHSDDLNQIKFIAYKFPGYSISTGVNLFEVNEIESIDDLPDSTTTIQLKFSVRISSVVKLQQWPSSLQELRIWSNTSDLILSLPPTLRKIVVDSPAVTFESKIPPLAYLELHATSIKVETSEPILVKKLSVWGQGGYDLINLNQFVSQCRGVKYFRTDVFGLEYPSSTQEIGVYSDCVPRDDRVTDFTLVQGIPDFKLRNLKRLAVSLNGFRGLLIPPSVSVLELNDLSPTKFSPGTGTVLAAGVVRPDRITSLTLISEFGLPLNIPSLQKWGSLNSLKVKNYSMPYSKLDAPQLESVKIKSCHLVELELYSPVLRRLILRNNNLQTLHDLGPTVEYLDISSNNICREEITVPGEGLHTLIVDNNPIQSVRYVSTRLKFAQADWGRLKYFGPVHGNTTQLPQYVITDMNSKILAKDCAFDREMTQIYLEISTDGHISMPSSLEAFCLFSIDASYLSNLAPLWPQTPNLKYFIFDVFYKPFDDVELHLPSSAVYISLSFQNIEPMVRFSLDDIRLVFDGPTKLEWLFVSNRRIRWATIGGRSTHPNLKVVNNKPVELFED